VRQRSVGARERVAQVLVVIMCVHVRHATPCCHDISSHNTKDSSRTCRHASNTYVGQPGPLPPSHSLPFSFAPFLSIPACHTLALSLPPGLIHFTLKFLQPRTSYTCRGKSSAAKGPARPKLASTGWAAGLLTASDVTPVLCPAAGSAFCQATRISVEYPLHCLTTCGHERSDDSLKAEQLTFWKVYRTRGGGRGGDPASFRKRQCAIVCPHFRSLLLERALRRRSGFQR